ncbi:MAG: glycoside hydrolase family 3 C-terminal domain-containing protein [Acholeplasmataceae bacterium]|jgi:beta-glucosidase|nr:glycoside hydrolase family 3 C-terminal domain-containing protein [Acholeplasmataceae bacterium]
MGYLNVRRVLVKTLTWSLILMTAIFSTSVLSFAATSSYDSKEEAIIAGAVLNERIALEGMVLLKNTGNALPLETGLGTDATRISVFGYKSVFPDGGGSTGADASGGVVRLNSDIYTSLLDAGYAVNPTMKEIYSSWSEESSENRSDYWFMQDANYASMLASMQSSYTHYNDAAVIVLTATNLTPFTGGGWILPPVDSTQMLDPDGNIVPGLHKRQFDSGQLALVNEVTTHFDNVIVVINSSVPVEMAPLQNNPAVDAIILAGEPGSNGFNALGKLMKGDVNFSGKLVDTYMTDYTLDPTFNNWARNGVFGDATTPSGNQYTDVSGTPRNAWFVDYEEGIYLGYRYYETRGYEEFLSDGNWSWYDANVVYPFGYGLSYTSFSWIIKGTSTPAGVVTSDDTIKLNIEVTNTGTKEGKDVVELYYTAPYTDGGIEKSHVVLGDFAKTDTLAPGESQTVTLNLKVRDMASYDYNDKNSNLFSGYELEAGTYQVKLMSDSHTVVDQVNYTVALGEQITHSTVTGNVIQNQFSEVNTYVDTWLTDLLTRESNGLSNPTSRPTSAEQILTDAEFAKWTAIVDAAYDAGQPWEVAAVDAPNAPADPATRPAVAEIMLSELKGKSYDDPMWEDLIDQLSLVEMTTLINSAGFNTAAIEYIGKPRTFDTDGPKGWSGTGIGGDKAPLFATEVVIASTWNKELAFEMGQMIGEQGLWGNSDVQVGVKTYSGWYAPAMNTHRSIFDSRYTEYYSEDGYLAGIMAANASLGAKSKGAYVYIKHFALHEDGGTDRGIFGGDATSLSSGLSVWANEQSIREIYLKPFQIAVEQGDASAVMSSFSRIGYTWAGGDYGLLTEILRNEWGFKGFVVTDIAIYGFVNADQMIRAGGDAVLSAMPLAPAVVSTSTEKLTATQLTAIRRAVKSVLYTTVHSNAMDVPIGAKVNYESKNLNLGVLQSEYSVNVADASLNTQYAYSTLSYALTAGELPEGLSFDAVTGDITGTPTRIGTYTFIITASAEGYTPQSVEYVVTVDDNVTLDQRLEELRTEILAQVTAQLGDESDATIAEINAAIDSAIAEISDLNTDLTATIDAAVADAIAEIISTRDDLIDDNEVINDAIIDLNDRVDTVDANIASVNTLVVVSVVVASISTLMSASIVVLFVLKFRKK